MFGKGRAPKSPNAKFVMAAGRAIGNIKAAPNKMSPAPKVAKGGSKPAIAPQKSVMPGRFSAVKP